MKVIALLAFVAVFAGLSSGEKDRFDNYKVFTIEVDTEQQLSVLQEIEKVAFSSYDFWKRPTRVGQAVDLMVPPHKMSEFEEIMADLSFRKTLKISDVQLLIDNEQPKNPRSGFNWERYQTMDEINAWLDHIAVDLMVPPHKMSEFEEIMADLSFRTTLKIPNVQVLIDNEQPKNPRSGFNWDRYWTMDEINAWLDQLVIDYSDVLTPISYGYSYELEQIKGVLLSYRPGNPAVFIESHIHAREWIAGATATWLLNEFLTSTDPEIRYIAENYDWYIFPVTNPDGYRHSHDTNRMWRKTRSRHGVLCRGADPNRNFAYQWQGCAVGVKDRFDNYKVYTVNVDNEAQLKVLFDLENVAFSSYDFWKRPTKVGLPVDIMVPPHKASEFDEIMRSLSFTSFHSFLELLLYPFGYTANQSPIAADLQQIGEAAAERLRQPFGTEYRVFNGHSLYIATGNSIDWTYGAAGINLSYAYEFRDDGTYGFLLPADQIIPNSIEVMQSLIGMIDESERLGHLP
uniref:Zinc carboxypeptidase A 1 n=1 Tax=Lutzomyia longipalpis TaxID=7200 RepID=A0A1B0CK34_LUTLO